MGVVQRVAGGSLDHYHRSSQISRPRFFERLNTLLAEAEFDCYVEELSKEYHAGNVGRGSIPPGVYFRMLFVGYEELNSERGIAWRCSDSFSLRAFLDIPLNKPMPDHSSVSRIRQRLRLVVHEHVVAFVLQVAQPTIQSVRTYGYYVVRSILRPALRRHASPSSSRTR